MPVNNSWRLTRQDLDALTYTMVSSVVIPGLSGLIEWSNGLSVPWAPFAVAAGTAALAVARLYMRDTPKR